MNNFMKKTLLSFVLMNFSFTMIAQVQNGNLDSWNTSTSNPTSWMYDFGQGQGSEDGTNNFLTGYGEALTTTQISGVSGGSAAFLESINATSATVINAGLPVIPGKLIGEWNYSGSDLTSVSYSYDARPLAGDTALIQVALYNFGGQTVAYALDLITPAEATTGWTSKTLQFVSGGNTGSIVKIEIWCQSSITQSANGSYTAGSTLKVDNFVLSASAASLEENTALNVNVFPNPTNETLTVNSNLEIENIAIISLDGKIVKTQQCNGTSKEINVSDLNSGSYIYEVKTTNGFVSRKTFVKN
jgi:hypothetical protein